MPARIQRRRQRGWRMPEGAVYVGRGTRWGNPARVVYHKDTGGWHVEHDHSGLGVGTFHSDREARRYAVEAYRCHLKSDPELAERARHELAGRDLACWCPLPELGQPDHCHAVVLLEIANVPEEPTR